MTEQSHVHTGRCHCGAITLMLSLPRPAEEMQVRACQCEFCTRHASLTVSDPNGSAVFEIEAGAFSPYRFGTRTATSLICARCGIYAGVVLVDGAQTWSVANARGLAIPDFKERIGVQMFYEEETADERVARRKQKWTPTELRFKL
jgi:hypothetical protein